MKTSGQVVHHLRQRVFRAQKKYLSFHLKRSSYNCQHNILTKREHEYKGEISSCTHPEYIESKPFNVEVGQLTRVVEMSYYPACGESNPRYRDCPHFTPRKSKEELQVEFRKTLLEKSKNPAALAESHPDIAQLLWVLGVESLESLDSLPEQEPEEESSQPEETSSDISEPPTRSPENSMPGTLRKDPLPEPPTLSLITSTPRTIRQTPTFSFFSWISWIWK